MTIDIEGLEYDVLSSFDLKNKGPKILTLELNTTKEKMKELLENAGYFLFMKVWGNYTWIKNEYRDVIF